MSELGHEISIHDSSNRECGEFDSFVRQSKEQAKNFDYNSTSLRIAHQFDLAPSIGHGRRFGYTFFELDSLTELEQHHLNSLDVLIVPSKWATSICNKYINDKIEVCPPGFNDLIFKPIEYMPPSCVFLSLGKWEVRKQQDQIVRAFSKAFNYLDNVHLWMSCDNQFIPEVTQERKNHYKALLGDKINLIPKVKTPADVARLMQSSYCFVSPSLAEGWNLPLLEAMACGKFTIATNYSGHTEFCTPETTILLEPTGLIPADDGMWFKPNSEINCGDWCTYDEEELVEGMRAIYKKYKEREVLNRAGVDRAKDFTWKKSAETMSKILGEYL